jgi:hypothetical protein
LENFLNLCTIWLSHCYSSLQWTKVWIKKNLFDLISNRINSTENQRVYELFWFCKTSTNYSLELSISSECMTYDFWVFTH